ncbi:MAG: hypothetical protein U9Q07_04190 [Planctomycetota bacterium]|nr:hypothetical protein [Planctomycetota bacterium]
MENLIELKNVPEHGGRIEAVYQGQRVTLNLTPAQVHDPSEMPTYLAGYKPFPFRADEASPVVLVPKSADKYRNFAANDAFRLVTVENSDAAPPPLVDPSSSLTSYKTVNKYLGAFVPKQVETEADNFSPLQQSAKRVKWALMQNREAEVWTLLGTAGNWAATQRTAAGTAWDAAGGNPILDLQTGIEKSLQMVTDIWMNQQVAHAMLRNDNVRDHMRQFGGDDNYKAVGASVANAQSQAVDFAIPGFPPFHVVAAKYLEETTSTHDYHLGKVAVLTTRPNAVPTDAEEIASTYTFRRDDGFNTGYEVRQFFVDGLGPRGGEMVVVSCSDVAILTGNTIGGIITNAHS